VVQPDGGFVGLRIVRGCAVEFKSGFHMAEPDGLAGFDLSLAGEADPVYEGTVARTQIANDEWTSPAQTTLPSDGTAQPNFARPKGDSSAISAGTSVGTWPTGRAYS
jgi:hypothetical protein